MIEKGSMFKAWEATTEQQKKAHEMQAIYKAPETVGQATGILDKRARDIFEGDILKIHHKTPLPVDLAVVKYDKKQSAFRAFPVDRPWYACQIAYPDEIVGNIYDNPDLLKQGEDTQK